MWRALIIHRNVKGYAYKLLLHIDAFKHFQVVFVFKNRLSKFTPDKLSSYQVLSVTPGQTTIIHEAYNNYPRELWVISRTVYCYFMKLLSYTAMFKTTRANCYLLLRNETFSSVHLQQTSTS